LEKERSFMCSISLSAPGILLSKSRAWTRWFRHSRGAYRYNTGLHDLRWHNFRYYSKTHHPWIRGIFQWTGDTLRIKTDCHRNEFDKGLSYIR